MERVLAFLMSFFSTVDPNKKFSDFGVTKQMQFDEMLYKLTDAFPLLDISREPSPSQSLCEYAEWVAQGEPVLTAAEACAKLRRQCNELNTQVFKLTKESDVMQKVLDELQHQTPVTITLKDGPLPPEIAAAFKDVNDGVITLYQEPQVGRLRMPPSLWHHGDFAPGFAFGWNSAKAAIAALNKRPTKEVEFNINDLPEGYEVVPYELGKEYKTLEGKKVRFVKVHNEGTSYETMEDEDGVNRYTQRDFGRCTGTCHGYSCERNTPPLLRKKLFEQ